METQRPLQSIQSQEESDGCCTDVLSFFAGVILLLILLLIVVPFVWLKMAKFIRVEKEATYVKDDSIVSREKQGASVSIYIQEHLFYHASASLMIRETHFLRYVERMSKLVLSWSNILTGSLHRLLAVVGIEPDKTIAENPNARENKVIEMKTTKSLKAG
jgi:hypothetical protein